MEVTGNISLDYLDNALPFLLKLVRRDSMFPVKVRVFILQEQVEIHSQDCFPLEPQFSYLRQARLLRNELSVNHEIEAPYNNPAAIISLYKSPCNVVVLSREFGKKTIPTSLFEQPPANPINQLGIFWFRPMRLTACYHCKCWMLRTILQKTSPRNVSSFP